VPRFNRAGSEKGERAGYRQEEERERKGSGMGRKEDMGNSDGGGELRHCS